MDFVVNGGSRDECMSNDSGSPVGDGICQDLKRSVEKKASFQSLSRTSSKSSIYELVSEEVEDCSDVDLLKAGNRNEEDFVIVSELEESDDCSSDNGMNASEKDDKSDTGLSDELYIIEDDDANDMPEGSNCASVKDSQKALSDGDDIEMDEIIAEFAKEEKKESEVIKFSDQEDEIDSILEDFAIADSPVSSPQKSDVILSAEVDKEVESILEAFSKADDSDDDDDCYIVEEDEGDSSFIQSPKASADISESPNMKINSIQVKETSCSTPCEQKLESEKSNEVQLLSSQKSENLSEVAKVNNSIYSDLGSNCSKDKTDDEKEKISDIKRIFVSKNELLETNYSSKLDVAESLDEKSEVVREQKHSAISEQFNIESEETNSSTDLILSITGIGEKSVPPENVNVKSDCSQSKQSSHVPISINSGECPSDIGNYIDKNLHFSEDESFSISEGASDTFASAFNVLVDMLHAIDTAYHDFGGNKTSQNSRKISECVSEGRKVFIAEINPSRAADVCYDDKGSFSNYQGKHEVQKSFKDKEDIQNKSSPVTNSVESHSDLSEKLLNSELASDAVEAKRMKIDLSLQDRELQRDSLKEIGGDEEELSVKSASNTSQSKMPVPCLEPGPDCLKVPEDINSSEEDKKRKLNNLDMVKNDAMNKKLKKDNYDNVVMNGSNEESEDMKKCKSKDVSNDAVIDFKNKEKVYQVIPLESCKEIETKKKWLEKIAASICGESVMEYFPKQFILEVKKLKELEKKNHILNQDLKLCQEKASDFLASQRAVFKEHNFVAKVPCRTVGVNVKIYRECDIVSVSTPEQIQSYNSMMQNSSISGNSRLLQNQAPKPSPKKMLPVSRDRMLGNSVEKFAQPVSNSSTSTVPAAPSQQILQGTLQPMNPNTIVLPPGSSQQILTQALSRRSPRIISQINRPLAPVSVPQRYVSVLPNVSIAGNKLVPVVNTTNPLQSSAFSQPVVVFSPNKPKSVANSNQFIDLTKDESQSAAQKSASGSSSVTSMSAIPSTLSKVNNLPSLPNNSNVLVPISNFLQIIPPSPSISQSTLSNPMQMTRQSFIPPLQSGLIGQRAVAVQLNVGPRNIPMQSFNQRLPTYFLRVTHPATAASINTPVNSSPKMAMPPLPSTSISSPQQSSGLILISRTSKHPAPFPPVPTYPPNAKLKATPPQPSLKGSKAPNGIILSWNMNLFNSHAEISNYQLFAYQETNGPVSPSLWKKVGDVKALPLPMACTLTQFVEGHRYFFTVRAVDIYLRTGPYSDPVSIMYTHQETDTAASK